MPHQKISQGIYYIKKDENPCMKRVILTKTHEYVCNGEVDDVHVGDCLHLLVGQHCHQDQKVSTDSHLKAEICHHIFHFPCNEIYQDYLRLYRLYQSESYKINLIRHKKKKLI